MRERNAALMRKDDPEPDTAGENEDGSENEDPASRKEPAPEDLAPKTLRDLADLAEQRAQGAITEAEFDVRRRQILSADPGAN